MPGGAATRIEELEQTVEMLSHFGAPERINALERTVEAQAKAIAMLELRLAEIMDRLNTVIVWESPVRGDWPP